MCPISTYECMQFLIVALCQRHSHKISEKGAILTYTILLFLIPESDTFYIPNHILV